MNPSLNATLPEEYILTLKARVQELEDLYRRLPEEIREVRKRYEAALLFAPPGFDPEVAVIRAVSVPTSASSAPSLPAEQVVALGTPQVATEDAIQEGRIGWRSAMLDVLSMEGRGLTHKELLSIVRQRYELPVSNGEKGFYNAVAKMIKAGTLVKHGNHLFTADLFEDARARGALPDEVMVGRRPGGSPELVLQVLRAHPEGLSASQLREIFASMPEAPQSLSRHGQYIYNVLSTLVGNAQIVREEGVYRLSQENKT